jgi:outer membrane murein-binding lipoprotein Lpp
MDEGRKDMTAQKRIDAALNTPTSALQEIRELKARIAELEADLVECRQEIQGLYQDAAGASL